MHINTIWFRNGHGKRPTMVNRWIIHHAHYFVTKFSILSKSIINKQMRLCMQISISVFVSISLIIYAFILDCWTMHHHYVHKHVPPQLANEWRDNRIIGRVLRWLNGISVLTDLKFMHVKIIVIQIWCIFSVSVISWRII